MRGIWVRFPETYVEDVNDAAEDMETRLHQATKIPRSPDLEAYALLVVVTDTPLDRAVVYLEDCAGPVHARGRLLLRAAERALREAGAVEPHYCPTQDKGPL